MLSKIIKASRPLYWLAHFCAFTFGTLSVPNPTFDLYSYFFPLILIAVPYSLFIYAINDYYDAISDAHNPRKGSMFGEKKHDPVFYKKLPLLTGIGFSITYLGLLIYSFDIIITLLLLSFCVFYYSSPPLRFKSIPFVDGITGGALYTGLTALIGYFAQGYHFSDLSLTTIPIPIIIMALLGWIYQAMGAVVDEILDRIQGIKTGPVVFGPKTWTAITLVITITVAFLIRGNPLLTGYIVIIGLIEIPIFFKVIRQSVLADKLIGQGTIYVQAVLLLSFMIFNYNPFVYP